MLTNEPLDCVYFITRLNAIMISILTQGADLIIPVAEQQISQLGRVTHQYGSSHWNARKQTGLDCFP